MKHIFIVNPKSGKGKVLEFIKPKIEEYAKEHNAEIKIWKYKV